MPEALFDQGKIHVASNQVGCQRVLERMGVALRGRDAGGFSASLKYAEEL
jgi:hypothetical protein